jgi:hypothetical protein
VQVLPVLFNVPFWGSGAVAIHLMDEYSEHPANLFFVLFDLLIVKFPLLQIGQVPIIAC